jgi:hypothetical protein
VIEVDNNTNFDLVIQSSNHQHGGFTDLPKADIAPRSADAFGSQSAAGSAGSIATGCEGSIVYQGDDFTFLIHWDNLFFGRQDVLALCEDRTDLFCRLRVSATPST